METNENQNSENLQNEEIENLLGNQGTELLKSISNADAFASALPELAETFMPKLRFMLPLAKAKLLGFINEHNAIGIIKAEKNGDVSLNIFDKSKIEIKMKVNPNSETGEKYKPSDGICKDGSGRPMVYNINRLEELMEGEEFANMLKTMDFSKMFS